MLNTVLHSVLSFQHYAFSVPLKKVTLAYFNVTMKKFLFILLTAHTSVCLCQQKPANMANRFLHSLTTLQQKKIQYAFTDNERFDWHFIPRNDRKGIPLAELSEQQKKAAFDLLSVCLSEQGVRKVKDIIQLESVLKQLEKRGEDDHFRDGSKYYFTLFGTPAPDSIWGWRLEGHHVSFTFSAENNRLVSGTPGFMGANPAIVPDGPYKGKETFKEETDGGFALLHALDKDQLNKAVINVKAPSDIITSASRKAMIDHSQGIYYSELNKDQQNMLWQLVELYVHRYTKLFADDLIKELRTAGIDKLQFAWAGAQQKGSTEGYYYRIQGPAVIIEYDNTQNNANHVHTVLRDLQHDFGGDELEAHYRADH